MANVEEIKKASRHLRGGIEASLEAGEPCFNDDDKQLIKFHGMYQQDDRDQRIARIKAKEDPAYILMLRCKIPGGRLSASQYLELDKLADEFGNGTLRVTTRQVFQYHGVMKDTVKNLIARINRLEVTTFGGCGDVCRNVMATPWPLDCLANRQVQEDAQSVSTALLPRTKAYFDIWINGEKVVREDLSEEVDPLYGETYLPRKFKAAVVLPPDNDVDVYSQDLGMVAHCPNGPEKGVAGYTILVGGGFGMSHGNKKTYPHLAQPLFYVERSALVEAAKAVLMAFRDHGDRTDRKHARLKYVIAEKGIEFFRTQTLKFMQAETYPAKSFTIGSVADRLGWHKQHDNEGRYFYCAFVESGRIKDDQSRKIRSGLREVVRRFQTPVHLTGNQNIMLCDIAPSDRRAVEEILKAHGMIEIETLTQARQMSVSCVALPTCALALSESERVFYRLMDEIDPILRELKIDREHILFRMTGCPNGCARPYNADFAFVGRGIDKYAVYIGGSYRGDRLAGLAFKSVNLAEIPNRIRPILTEYAQLRLPDERFTEYWSRTQVSGEAPSTDHFHQELAERAKKAKGERSCSVEE